MVVSISYLLLNSILKCELLEIYPIVFLVINWKACAMFWNQKLWIDLYLLFYFYSFLMFIYSFIYFYQNRAQLQLMVVCGTESETSKASVVRVFLDNHYAIYSWTDICPYACHYSWKNFQKINVFPD